MNGPSSGSGYDDRDQYTPRYPGSDAPGYSANPSTSQYGQAAPSQYGSTGSQYPPATSGAPYGSGAYTSQTQYAQDPRYSNQAMQMGGYQAQPENAYVDVGAHRLPMSQSNTQAYRDHQYGAGAGTGAGDMMTTGAAQPSTYATAGVTQGGYGQTAGYYGQQAPSYGQQPMQQPIQQPHDPFMGRMGQAADHRTTSPGAGKPPQNYPGTSKTASNYPSAAAGHTSPPYSTQPQYDDREQPSSRQVQSNASSSRQKESRSHHSDRYHKHR
jgi:hypothetical protein